MANNNPFSGNKFSLRSRTLDQIKRIDLIAKLAPKVGDTLVTTWSNLIMVMVTIGGGALWISKLISEDHFALLVKNLVPVLIIAVGFLLVAFNVALTNPSFGSQFVTSLSYLRDKYEKKGLRGKKQKIRPYRLVEIDGVSEVVETRFRRNKRYMMMYQVRGSVSPVSFDGELAEYARLNGDLLSNLDMDATIDCINVIQNAEVHQKALSPNATPEMIRRRNINYRTVKSLNHNQQLKTLVVITSHSLNTLYSKVDTVENAFNRGMVIGYIRLRDKQLQKEFSNIFG